MNTIEQLKESMKESVDELDIIQAHRAYDLGVDFHILNEHVSHEYIWIQRTCGTELIPLFVGHDPYPVSHYMGDGAYRDSKAKAFHIKNNRLRPVSRKKAFRLVNVPPAIPVHSSTEHFSRAVAMHLDKMTSFSGMFDPKPRSPNDWEQWRKHYETAGNLIMSKWIKHCQVRLVEIWQEEKNEVLQRQHENKEQLHHAV